MSVAQQKVSGLKCRACGCRDLRVVWVRQRGDSVVRLRRCRNCGADRRTVERGEV